MAKLLATAGPVVTTTVTFTTNQTWTSPVGVTNLITVVGKGQDGAPAVPPYYDPAVTRDATVVTIRGFQYVSTNSPYGYNDVSGTWDWSSSQNDAPNAASTLNIGGTGTVYGMSLIQYGVEYHYDVVPINFTNAITGSATSSTDGPSFWKTSGPVASGDWGNSYVTWHELGAFHSGVSATTGASTTGFSKTFSGGVGVEAATTTYHNVTITASTGYPIVVPSGGYITITY